MEWLKRPAGISRYVEEEKTLLPSGGSLDWLIELNRISESFGQVQNIVHVWEECFRFFFLLFLFFSIFTAFIKYARCALYPVDLKLRQCQNYSKVHRKSPSNSHVTKTKDIAVQV